MADSRQGENGGRAIITYARGWQSLAATRSLGRRGVKVVTGDEFGLLLRNTDLGQASVMAERLQRKMTETAWPVDTRLTASIGIAKFIRDDDPAAFIDRASQALRRAQDAGENQIASLEEDAKPVAQTDPN